MKVSPGVIPDSDLDWAARYSVTLGTRMGTGDNRDSGLAYE